jgi:hypothetical protein
MNTMLNTDILKQYVENCDISKVTYNGKEIKYLLVDGALLWYDANDEDVVSLEVKKELTYIQTAGEASKQEKLILLDIYPKRGGTVIVKYGDLTKIIVDDGTKYDFNFSNGQQVFFGTYRGVTDEVSTPDEGTLTISGDVYAFASGSTDSEESVKPYSLYRFAGIKAINSFGDTISIPHYAFNSNEYFTNVVIPNGIEYIGTRAFQNSSITKIDIPASATTIANDAFIGCKNLTNITVDETNPVYKSIDGNLYSNNATDDRSLQLEQYALGKSDTIFRLPESATKIGSNALSYASSLTHIYLHKDVIDAGDGNGTYIGCTNLANIIVDEENPYYESIDGNLYIKVQRPSSPFVDDGVTLVRYAPAKTNPRFDIPDGVQTIYINAFRECTSLKSIVIPNSVTQIYQNIVDDSNANFTTVYYMGNEQEWNNIYIYSNDTLKKAKRYYYSETEPTTEGNFWHYLNGIPVIWGDVGLISFRIFTTLCYAQNDWTWREWVNSERNTGGYKIVGNKVYDTSGQRYVMDANGQSISPSELIRNTRYALSMPDPDAPHPLD